MNQPTEYPRYADLQAENTALRALIAAAVEALDVPTPADLTDHGTRTHLDMLRDRAGSARTALRDLDAPSTNPANRAAWLREKVAEQPITYTPYRHAPLPELAPAEQAPEPAAPAFDLEHVITWVLTHTLPGAGQFDLLWESLEAERARLVGEDPYAQGDYIPSRAAYDAWHREYRAARADRDTEPFDLTRVIERVMMRTEPGADQIRALTDALRPEFDRLRGGAR